MGQDANNTEVEAGSKGHAETEEQRASGIGVGTNIALEEAMVIDGKGIKLHIVGKSG